MSRIIHLAVPLPPKGKARPRHDGRNNRIHMPEDYLQWRREFVAHIAQQAGSISPLGWFAIGLTVGTPKGRMRPDLDNVLSAVLDALQDAGVIENDRLCWEILYTRRAKTKAKVYGLDIELHSVELEAA